MKVKIGDTIYDANHQPIMIILSKKDKENISNMAEQSSKYCAFPDSYDPDEILVWMAADTNSQK